MDFEELINRDLEQRRLLLCICCLEQSGPLIKLESCAHKECLKSFQIPDLNPNYLGTNAICYICHSTLKKWTQFRTQVQRNLNMLLNKVEFSEKLKNMKSNLKVSATVHHNMPEKIVEVRQNEESEYKKETKIKNIATALEILNSNTTSLKTLTSYHNFLGLTASLLEVTAGNLNLPSMRESVLPESQINKLVVDQDLFPAKLKQEPNREDIDEVTPVSDDRDTRLEDGSYIENAVPVVSESKTDIENVHRVPVNNEFELIRPIDFDNVTAVLPTNVKGEPKRIVIDFENVNAVSPIDIKKEPETMIIDLDNVNAVLPTNIKKEVETSETLVKANTVLSNNETQNKNNEYETTILANINKKFDDMLPDEIKVDPEEVESSLETNEIATTSSQMILIDPVDSPIQRGLVPVTLEPGELIRERVEKLQSAEFLKWTHRCDHCVVGFRYRANLADHMRRKHEKKSPGEESVTCDICQQVMSPADLEEHQSRHYNRLECVKCKRRFILFDEAMDHYKIVHQTANSKRSTARRTKKRKISSSTAPKRRGNKQYKLQKPSFLDNIIIDRFT